jgi:hypothetical protein
VALGFEEFMDETADNGLHVIPRSQRHSVQKRMVIGGQLHPKFFGACGHCALDISHVALFDMASVPGLAHPLRVRNQPPIPGGWLLCGFVCRRFRRSTADVAAMTNRLNIQRSEVISMLVISCHVAAINAPHGAIEFWQNSKLDANLHVSKRQVFPALVRSLGAFARKLWMLEADAGKRLQASLRARQTSARMGGPMTHICAAVWTGAEGHQAASLTGRTQISLFGSNIGSRATNRSTSRGPMPRWPLVMLAMVWYGVPSFSATPFTPAFRLTYSFQ